MTDHRHTTTPLPDALPADPEPSLGNTQDQHRPVPFFAEAGTGDCPHGDGQHERHQGTPDFDLLICSDAPLGEHCIGCLYSIGEIVPWEHCLHRTDPHTAVETTG
ncbi:hypothetical protein ACODT4_44005 [Streptomyces sp. 2.9]|uniref:hypothetical protein n=1 Tax=Streptomyces tritrimontium TaxID=3406573 RepID=UPI003BB6E618